MFIYRKSFKHIIYIDNTVWLWDSYYSNKKDTNHIIEYLYAINHIWLFQKLNDLIYVNFLGLFFTYLFDIQYVLESFRRFSTQLLTRIKSSKENFRNWINIIANYYLIGVHRWTWRIWRPSFRIKYEYTRTHREEGAIYVNVHLRSCIIVTNNWYLSRIIIYN